MIGIATGLGEDRQTGNAAGWDAGNQLTFARAKDLDNAAFGRGIGDAIDRVILIENRALAIAVLASSEYRWGCCNNSGCKI